MTRLPAAAPAPASALALALAVLALSACATTPAANTDPVAAPAATAHVLQGADRLDEAFPAVLAGRRVGLITNHTGRDRAGTPTIDLLMRRRDMQLVALFAPEHGIRGEVDERVSFEVDAKTGLPVHSLYGATNRPTPEMLKGVEALVFDIMDVGVRQYTYLRTMGMAIEAAAEAKIPFVVLDRIDPIGGDIVEGNIHEIPGSGFASQRPIASRHGLTAGELARFYNEHHRIGADLHVVRNEGWRRDMWLDDTDVPWRQPSPNLPLFSGVIHYPGTVFFEGTNLSEGRGSSHPFEQVGAPWLRAAEVAAAMNALGLPGVQFEAVEFDIAASALKFGGQRVNGIRLTATDRRSYRPVATAMRLMDTIRRLHPAAFEWRSSARQGGGRNYRLDALAGTTRIRAAIENGTLDALLAEWERDAGRFRAIRARYLLY